MRRSGLKHWLCKAVEFLGGRITADIYTEECSSRHIARQVFMKVETTPTTEATPATTKPASTRARVVIGDKVFFLGTGRRKTSVARVRIVVGTGKFIVNDRDVNGYFTEVRDQQMVRAPLVAANLAAAVDVFVNVQGGGFTGQTGAVVQGLGRAISLYDPALRKPINDGGFLTRDSRMKERKKYGLRGARRAFQFSKR